MTDFRPDVVYALFGAEDAENESAARLKEYFFRNRAFDSLVADLPIRILVGHKGVGKSALLKVAHLEDEEAGIPSIWLQPADLTTLDGTYDPRFDKATLAWQTGILKVIYEKIEDIITNSNVPERGNIVLATAKDLMSAVRALAKRHLDLGGEGLSRAITEKFLNGRKLYVYMDDLDRGWTGRRGDIHRLSALLNSLRDICGDFREIQFRIGLRSDVYYLIRTSDESTDKIEQYIVPLTWTNHDILVCMAKRIATYFGQSINDEDLARLNQAEIARHFHKVIDPVFSYHGKWEKAPIHRVLLSLTRRRPRDLVKMFSGAANAAYANRHGIISSEDLRSTFTSYSQDRLQDIINEFKSELPNIKALLLGMRPTSAHRKGDHPFLYKNDELSKKIYDIISSNSISFTNGEFVDFHTIKQFLYKVGFIVARKDDNGWINWVYFEEDRFAGLKEVDFGYSWEVHPAYRWALEKRTIQEIIDGVDLVSG